MTERAKSPFWLRLMPSLSDVAFLFPVIFLFYGLNGARRLIEGDTGWHLRTGEWILEHGQVPRVDMFSFTKPGEPWFAWEWLWDLGFSVLNRVAGLEAVVLASLFVISLTLLLLFRLCVRHSGNVLVAIAVTWVTAGLTSMHWWARPHMFTFLFLVAFLWIVTLAEEGRWRLLWLTPVLMAPWVNIHGGFLAGIIVLGAWAAHHLFRGVLAGAGEDRQQSLRNALRYGLAAAACGIATLANPYGWQLHVHIYDILSTSNEFFNQTIQEWQSFNFNSPAALYYVPLLLLGATAAWTNLQRGQFAAPLLLAAWFWMGLKSARNAPIFGLIAAPWIAWCLAAQLRALVDRPAGWIRSAALELNSIAEEFGETDRVERFMLLSAACWAVLIAFTYAPNPPEKLRAVYDSKLYPARALDYLEKHGGADRLFTIDEWGDYLIYRLYPRGRVYVDGRFDFYGKKFTDDDYGAVGNGRFDWEQKLERHGVRSVLLPVEYAVASTLKECPRWRVVYDDGMAILFERRGAPAQPNSLLTAAKQELVSRRPRPDSALRSHGHRGGDVMSTKGGATQ